MRRLWSLVRSRRLDRELDEEIAAHVAMQEEEFRARGMSREEARLAARREFGGVAQAKELYRERRGLPFLEVAGRDLRYALRGLARSKAFTAAAVLSLALGIGANTAVFALFRALMLRPLPVSAPGELVTLYRTGAWGVGISSYPLYLAIQKRADLFQGVIARSSIDRVRLEGARMETVRREWVTGNYFRVLGVGAAAGRVLGVEDDRTPHAHPVTVLSHEFWQSRFGGDPGLVGRTLVIDEQPLTVVGVAARGFRGIELDRQPDLWVPAMMRPGEIMEPGEHWAWIVARRRPEVSRAQVQAAMDVLLRQYLAGVYGENTNPRFRKIALAQHIEAREGSIGLSPLRDRFGGPLDVLMTAVGLVLLAACANLANLLFARGAARRREMALRISLGATRSRLVFQGAMESLLLAGFGVLGGIAFAVWGSDALARFLPQAPPFRMDGAILGFTAGLGILSAVLFGIGPAFESARSEPALALRGGSAGEGRTAARRLVVVAQVAFSVVLVALAALFGHSMSELRAVDVGIRSRDAIAFSLDFPASWSSAAKAALRTRLLSRIESMPGVLSASHASPGPYMNGSSSATVQVPGSAATANEPAWIAVHAVAPRYFETIGTTLLAGREVAVTDTASSPRVAVVNEAFVRQFLPGETRVLERVLTMGKGPVSIVGVARDIAHDGIRAKRSATVYIPAAQGDPWDPVIVVRAAIPPDELIAGIRREAARLGPQVAVSEPRTIRRAIEDSLLQDRLLATLGGWFAGLALALAGVGLYGVIAYGTARRAREIGIRIALGARRAEVLWMVLQEALALVGVGLAIGLPASYAAARPMASLLFRIRPLDPFALVSTAAVLAGVGMAAALIPARKAAGLDPLAVLRQD